MAGSHGGLYMIPIIFFLKKKWILDRRFRLISFLCFTAVKLNQGPSSALDHFLIKRDSV